MKREGLTSFEPLNPRILAPFLYLLQVGVRASLQRKFLPGIKSIEVKIKSVQNG
jgi:hypothetical protein